MLTESADLKAGAFAKLYGGYGAEKLAAVMAHHQAHEGISRIEKIRHCHREILGIDLSPDELADLGRQYSDLVEDQVVACAWVAGAREFLEAHAGRLPMFVVSGIPEDELKRVVQRRGMGGYFTAVRGSPVLKDVIIREILAAHGLAAERTVFVGDAMTDYSAAEATGVPFLGRVAPGRTSPFPKGTTTVPDLAEFAV